MELFRPDLYKATAFKNVSRLPAEIILLANVDKQWTKCGRNVNVDGMWQQSGKDVDEMWKESDRTMWYISSSGSCVGSIEFAG